MKQVWIDEAWRHYRDANPLCKDLFIPANVEMSREVLALLDRDIQFKRALYVGGRGHGKVYAQRVALAEYRRRSSLSLLMHKIPDVDPEKIRWRCRPPYSQPAPVGLFGGMLDGIMDKFSENSGFAARMEAYLDAQVNKPRVGGISPSVGHNVNVVTDRVPPHIAALPESEQGPALVEAIFERKRRAQK